LIMVRESLKGGVLGAEDLHGHKFFLEMNLQVEGFPS